MREAKQNPFLGLRPYSEQDRQILYGRDKDLILMKDRIFSARTTLLFAGSGVGKTSFLNAKIIPDMHAQYCVIYHSQWVTDEPLVGISKSLKAQFIQHENGPQAQLPVKPDSRPLLAQLSRFTKGAPDCGRGGYTRCLFVLDQFE